MSDAEHGAEALRDLASEALAIERGLAERLKRLAKCLDAVSKFSHTLGGGPNFETATGEASELARALMDEFLSPTPMAKGTTIEIRDTIAKWARKLADLWERASGQPFDGSVEDQRHRHPLSLPFSLPGRRRQAHEPLSVAGRSSSSSRSALARRWRPAER
jgi:hypothetical protein